MAHRVRNVKMHNRAKFRDNRSQHDRDIAVFQFQHSRRPPAWIFKNCRTTQEADLRRCTKFGRNRSNRGRDKPMAIFEFFKMAAGFFKFLTVARLRGPICVAMPNLVEIGQNAAELWRFIRYVQELGVPQ